jgi:hypothetical protein
MTNQEEKVERKASEALNPVEASFARENADRQVDAPDAALESEAAAIEGKVTEIAKTGVAEDVQPSGQAQDDDDDDAGKKQQAQDDKEALKAHLLQHAPKEHAMRNQVEKTLKKEKAQLESDIKKHRRRKDYHMLSKAVARLRQVIRQLEELVKVGYEKLKGVWLKVVHKIS